MKAALLLTAGLLMLGGVRSDVTAQQPSFSTSTELVVLHVNVQDRKGGFVTDLPQGAFAVFEDDRPRPIDLFVHRDTPVTVGLVIDNSISMQPHRELVIAAAVQFAQAGHSEDQVFALVFNEYVKPALPETDPFTDNPTVLREALTRAITARGRTALFDAVVAGLAYAERGEHPRKVLVVIGDGGDNESTTSFAEMIRRAQASNVVIYTVALVDPLDREANPDRMTQLAKATGGETFRPRSTPDVAKVLQRISADIRHTYTLGYALSRPPDGTFRRVRVIVSPPNGERVSVRTRGGYLADKLAARSPSSDSAVTPAEVAPPPAPPGNPAEPPTDTRGESPVETPDGLPAEKPTGPAEPADPRIEKDDTHDRP